MEIKFCIHLCSQMKQVNVGLWEKSPKLSKYCFRFSFGIFSKTTDSLTYIVGNSSRNVGGNESNHFLMSRLNR